mgnify:CR=1 FL=1
MGADNLATFHHWERWEWLAENFPIAAFALSGYSTVLLWRNMPTRCISAVEPNLAREITVRNKDLE